MNLLLKILKYTVGVLVLVLASGFLLPADYSAQRSMSIGAPVEKVFPLVANQKEWKRWSVWNQRDPNMEMTYAGPEAAVGSKWNWKSKTEGNGGMEWSALEANKRVAFILRMEGMSPGNGELTFAPEGNGTKVTWTMNGSAGMNPIFRWFGLFMDKLVGPDFEAGLKNLKKLAETA